MQCVCSDQLNIQLKAVLTIKHLSTEVTTFQQYFQSCQGALKILNEIAAPPIVPQARSLEPLEVRTVRDATQCAIDAVYTLHTVEKQTESAHLKERIQGFGNYEPPPEENTQRSHGVQGQVAEFVGDSIGDMVDDFKEKGAVGALKDATVDALDLVLDGVDAIWGFVAGKGNEANRICQPQGQFPGGFPGGQPNGAGYQRSPGAFAPPTMHHPTSASNHYAAAFSGGVVGANHPVPLSGSAQAVPVPETAPIPATEPVQVPSAMVDLLSLHEQSEDACGISPSVAAAPAAQPVDLLGAAPAMATSSTLDPGGPATSDKVADLLGDLDDGAASFPEQPTTQNMLDF